MSVEFEHLVGIPMKNKLLFMSVEESLKHEVIYAALHMHKKEVIENLERAYTLLEAQSWEVFYASIALVIYGIIFP